MKKLIIVNKQDKVLGYKSQEECHKLNGILHRAFSIFIFNNKGELLLQKRSKYKLLWPLYWSNTCCSHPRSSGHPELASGSLIKQAERRLKEEMGFTVPLKKVFKFQYKAVYKNKGSENELCYLLLGQYDGKVRLNKKEAADIKWVNVKWLKKDINKNPDIYTPWFKMEIKELIKRNIIS